MVLDYQVHLINRPLTFDEFEKITPQTIYVSATPNEYELKRSRGEIAQQIIRPTGLLDPIVEVRPASTQVPDLLVAARECVKNKERVLVTVLTKKLAEDLAKYIDNTELQCRYLHSDIETLERLEILRALREGKI